MDAAQRLAQRGLSVAYTVLMTVVSFAVNVAWRLFKMTGISDDAAIRFLIKWRWIAVIFLVLPLSRVFELYFKLRNWVFYKFLSVPQHHARRVARIQERIREWNALGRPGRLCTARNSWQMVSMRSHKYKQTSFQVDIALYDILNIDRQKMIVTVEPLVDIGHITKTLVPLGLTLPVVPELDDLTVGGMLAGYGIEASSHKYGLFNDIVTAFEMVTQDGSLVRCSRDENPELFYAMPWSYGGLGFLVSVDIRMIPALPYVRMEYRPYSNNAAAMHADLTTEASKENPHEFLEILQYSKGSGVLLVGDMVETCPSWWDRNSIRYWFKPWFYKHVETMMTRSAPHVEYIPLRDYYHRHTRSLFWEVELLIPFGNHPLFRTLLGWALPPKVSFLRLTEGETLREWYKNRHIVQDVLVPISETGACIEYFDQIFEGYPLWIVPHLVLRTEPQGALRIAPDKESEMYVDIGVWLTPGKVQRDEPFDSPAALTLMEQWLIAHRGYQALYAFSTLSREDHRKMFDMSLYDACRKRYKADGAFLDVYDKIKR